MRGAMCFTAGKEALNACLVPCAILAVMAVHRALHGAVLPLSHFFFVISLLYMHWGGFSEGEGVACDAGKKHCCMVWGGLDLGCIRLAAARACLMRPTVQATSAPHTSELVPCRW